RAVLGGFSHGLGLSCRICGSVLSPLGFRALSAVGACRAGERRGDVGGAGVVAVCFAGGPGLTPPPDDLTPAPYQSRRMNLPSDRHAPVSRSLDIWACEQPPKVSRSTDKGSRQHTDPRTNRVRLRPTDPTGPTTSW